MQSEKEYVVNLFKNNFSKYRDKKIVLYGTGPNTKNILENVKDFNIVGLMDGYKKDGVMYGMNILDYEDVLKQNIDMIIIIACATNKSIVYNRIEKFCVENNILTLDIYGNDLSKKEEEIILEGNEYFKKNEEELKELIRKCEAISFDIFDTLIMRKTLFPDDVFDIMSEKLGISEFSEVRKKCATVKENYTIQDIYNSYQKITGILDDEKNNLMKLELQIEKDILGTREKMVEIFNYAVSLNKKVYLISDMYLTKEILIEILDKLNIKGYKDIFVSCEYKMLKSQGLYKVYKEYANADSYLHIGDNFEADGIYAKLNGILAYCVKSSYEMLEISLYREILNENYELSDRVMLGMFIERIFNNPFAFYKLNGKVSIETAFDRGYLFMAPFISVFMLWFINNIKANNYTKVILSARDGYLISKLYDVAKSNMKLPEYVYLLTSRLASVSAALFSDKDIEYIAECDFGGTPEAMLKKRFFLKDIDIEVYKEGENIKEYILKHSLKITEVSKTLRKNYLEYIKKLDIDKDDKIAFFDFVSSGTCQMCLNKILNVNMDGLYFIRKLSDYDEKQKLNIKALFGSANAYEIKGHIYDNNFFLEYIIASFDPSLSHFDNLGNPIFLEDTRTSEYKKYLANVQDSIINYYSIFIKLVNNVPNIKLADMLFGFMQNKYTNIEDKMLDTLSLRDEFANR